MHKYNWTNIIKDYQYIEQISRNIVHFYYSSKQEADEQINKINEEKFTNYIFKRVCPLGEKLRNKLYNENKDYNSFLEVEQCGLKLKTSL